MNELSPSDDTIVIGGGHARIATGYYLKQHEQDFVILDGSERIGAAWPRRRKRLRRITRFEEKG